MPPTPKIQVPPRTAPPAGPQPKPPPAEADPWGVTQSMRVLLYGASGTGKTTLAATFPGPILWLRCSGGKNSGELRSVDTPEYRKKITPREIRTTDQVRGFVDEAGSGRYGTVVLDHASGLADTTLAEILGLEELPVQKGWGMATQQQYGQQSMQLKTMFKALLGLPCNVIIVAQERVFNSKEEGTDATLIQPTVGAALTPSVTGWLNPACDFVVRTFKRGRTETRRTQLGDKVHTTTVAVDGVDYCLMTGPHSVYQTKFRIPRGVPLPEYVPDPDYDKIQAVIAGTYRPPA